MGGDEKRLLQERLAAARGEIPVDLVLAGGRVVNLFDGSIEELEVAVHRGVVVGLGSYEGRQRVELDGAYLVPGFIDGHLHVESTMLTPAQLARVLCARGTAAVVADPHEIANVMGLEGVRDMLAASEGLPVNFYFMAPSCVPATHLETAGAELSAADLLQLVDHPRLLGLAEVMNFPGVVAGDDGMLDKLLAFADRPRDGHAPGLGGRELNAYLVGGPDSDHECTVLAEAREKLARGMWLMIRQGTAEHNLDDLLPLVDARNERRCLLVSDDKHPGDLARNGHLDATLRRAVSRGLDPVSALRLVTLNPARRFGLAGRGAVAPGYRADLVVLEDLEQFKVRQVFHAGRLVAREGRCVVEVAESFPAGSRHTVHLPPLEEASFQVPLGGGRARIIEMVPGQVATRQAVEEAPGRDGLLCADAGRDLALLAVIERHGRNGNLGHGLLRGLGLHQGALAGSVAHDSHNLVVAGMDPLSMLTAARAVAEMQGGLAVALGDRVLARLPLPVAGLMSEAGLESVLAELEELERAAGQCCRLEHPFMQLSFVALPVIPELRLSDWGLVDVTSFSLVDLFLP